MRKEFRREWGMWLLVTALAIGYWQLWRWVEPNYFLNDDNGNYFLGVYVHNYRALLDHGQLALINFHQHLGTLHLGQGQSGVLYPPVYFGLWLGEKLAGAVERGIELLVAGHWLAGVWGMVLLLRMKRMPRWIAVGGAFWYLSFPFVAGVSRSWVVVSYLFAYLPWNWWALERALTQGSVGRWIILGGIKLLLVYQGYLQWVVVAAGFELGYLWLAGRSRVKGWRAGIGAVFSAKSGRSVILVWLVVALLGMPLLLPMWRSASLSTERDGSLGLARMLANRVPVEEGVLAQLGVFRDGVVFDGSSYIFFVGIVPLTLAVWLWQQRKKLGLDPDEQVWGVAALLAGASCTVLYAPAVLVPILNQFRWPMKHLVIFEFFLVVFISIGLARWLGQSRKAAVGALVLGILIGSNVLVMWRHRGVGEAFSEYVVVPPVENRWQAQVDINSGRVLAYGVDPHQWESNESLLAFNLASVARVWQFSGYDAAPAKTTLALTQYIPAWGTSSEAFTKERIEYLRSWGVRYLVTQDKSAFEGLVAENTAIVSRGEFDGVYLAEVPTAWPLVFWQEGGSLADFLIKGNDIAATATGGGTLVFNVRYWPEYRASVDGRVVEVGEYQARPVVQVPRGGGRVVLTFEDAAFGKGVRVALATAVILLFSAAGRVIRVFMKE